MSSIFNKGSQIITWDFKNPVKARYFDRLNRNIIKPGVYKGLTINFAGTTVSVATGSAVLNCIYNALDFLQIKVDFETSYSFSEQIYPSMIGSKEIIYLEYEYAEITENFVDIRHMSSVQYFLSPIKNSIIIGELLFDGLNNIIGIDYSNKTWGMVNADIDHGIPDTTFYFNTISNTKKWKATGVLLPTGTKELQYQAFNESTGRILTTSPSNTTQIENKLSVGSTEESTSISTGAMTLLGGLGVAKNLNVGGRLECAKFYGRIPLGSVIPVIGVFSSSGNGGMFTSASLPISGNITDDGFQRCDGAIINNVNSVFNGRYTPDISDNRFIQGATSAGSISNDTGVNNGNNTVTLTTNEMPSHQHGTNVSNTNLSHTHTYWHGHGGGTDYTGDHVHAYTPYGQSVSFNNNGTNQNFLLTATSQGDGAVTTTDSRGRHNHSISADTIYPDTGPASGATMNHSHIISSEGNGASFDIRPKYINAVYLIRVL